jgi:hypothetical protein
MRRLATSLVPALAGVGVAAALQHGLFAGLPDFVRVSLAFLVLVMLPGAGWLRAIGTLPPGGAWLAPGFCVTLFSLSSISCALAKRSSGFFWHARIRTLTRPSGISGRRCRGSGSGAWSC